MSAAGATRPRLTLLGRPECGLCEEMETALLERFGAGAYELMHADVDSDEVWRRRYGLRIPVLLDADGEVVCEGHFDAEAVTEAVLGRRRKSLCP